MKPHLLALVAAVFFTTGGLFAQVPQAINYQAIARDANGHILANTNISLRFTLNQGNNPGTMVYQETQAATTNQFGLFTVAIGQGQVISGTFSTINWATADVYLHIELDPAGGTNYVSMGSSQLLSVPYALYSGSAANGNWLSNGNNIHNANTGNVGIGTSTPGMLLDVTSPVDTNGNAAIRGIATGTTNNVYGVMGITTGTGYSAAGVYGLTSVANASGVFGETHSATNTAGVYGQADSSGWALFGYNNNLDGRGVAVGAYLGGSGGIAVDANANGGSAIAVNAISKSTLGTDTTIAGYYKATGGIANYALLVPAGGGNVGIGTATPTTLLDVESATSPAFKLNDGTQAAGSVLTSDANGNASWQTPGGGVEFFAVTDTSTVLDSVKYTQIPFQTVRFNSGNAYNPATNLFTAPSDGFYHFDANVALFSTKGDFFYMYLRVNGGLNAGTVLDLPTYLTSAISLSTGVMLTAGQTVDIEIYTFKNGDLVTPCTGCNTSYFSGYKVR